jgi:lysozyme
MAMDAALRRRLAVAAGGGVLAASAAFVAWYEGTGPVRVIDGVRWYYAYPDTGNIWTACHGLTGPGIVQGARFTQAQCDEMERVRGAANLETLRRLLPGFDGWPPWRQVAMFSFLWNLGEPALAGSTMRRRFLAGDAEGGCAELVKWSKARVGGVLQTLKGLLARREAEMQLCLSGLDEGLDEGM